jgi:hypothetical protein
LKKRRTIRAINLKIKDKEEDSIEESTYESKSGYSIIASSRPN